MPIGCGICWLTLGYTLALHVLDEAGHDFLAFYIPNALAIRRAVPFFAGSDFYRSWIGSLALALTLLLAFAPLAFRGQQWIRWLGVLIAILPGISTARGIFFRRFT